MSSDSVSDRIAAMTALGEQYFLDASTGSRHLQGKATLSPVQEEPSTTMQQVALLGQQFADWVAAAVPGTDLWLNPDDWICLGDEDLPQRPVSGKRIPRRNMQEPQGRRHMSHHWICLGDEDPPQQPVHVKQVTQRTRTPRIDQREKLVGDLFRLHDLNRNGFLEEEELVKLNEKISMLHCGTDIDKQAIRRKYKELFRSKFDPQGRPVPYPTFRSYMFQVLQKADPDDVRAQEMILEQFIAEAQSGIEAFRFDSFHSVTDAPYLATMSFAGPHTMSRF